MTPMRFSRQFWQYLWHDVSRGNFGRAWRWLAYAVAQRRYARAHP